MKKGSTALAFLMLIAIPVFGDAVDEAEAKKRGVSVEIIQLENARGKINELQNEVTHLRVELKKAQEQASKAASEAAESRAALEKLNREITPEQKRVVDKKGGMQKKIEEAIANHKIIPGMTVADIEESLKETGYVVPVKTLEEDATGTKVCEWTVRGLKIENDATTDVTYTVTLMGGRVAKYEKQEVRVPVRRPPLIRAKH